MTRKAGRSGVVLFLCGALAGCASATAEPVAPLQDVSGMPADDQSRCAFENRPDREVSETKEPTARFPSVRRVYGVLGDGDDRRRVLLCREADTNLDGIKDIVRTYNDRGEALNELADANYDGKIDTWITFSRGRVTKIQLDGSGRGTPDETRLYVAGKLSRVQRDTNGDGRPDVWEIYADGQLQRVGVDLDADGHVDRWDRDAVALRAADERERERERERAAAEQRSGSAPPSSGAATPAQRP